MNAYVLKIAVDIFNSFISDATVFQYCENTIYTLDPLALSLSVVKSHYCWDSKKSLQMPLITSETIGSNPVNSLVKKA